MTAFLLFRDVQTAEELLNQHAEVGDDIRAKQDEFTQLIALGEKMYKRSAVICIVFFAFSVLYDLLNSNVILHFLLKSFCNIFFLCMST
jgi:hypothetical protein